jgi:hypothetical protein
VQEKALWVANTELTATSINCTHIVPQHQLPGQQAPSITSWFSSNFLHCPRTQWLPQTKKKTAHLLDNIARAMEWHGSCREVPWSAQKLHLAQLHMPTSVWSLKEVRVTSLPCSQDKFSASDLCLSGLPTAPTATALISTKAAPCQCWLMSPSPIKHITASLPTAQVTERVHSSLSHKSIIGSTAYCGGIRFILK